MILLDQAGAGAQTSKLISPDLALKRFVEHFWVQDAPATNASQKRWRIVPDANPYIILIVSRGARFLEGFRCVVVGARSQFADISVVNRVRTLGVRLHPGSLPLLTRLPASDFTDRCVPIEDVFGVRGKLLFNRLADHRSAMEALRILAKFLCKELSNHRPLYEGDALNSRNNRAKDLASSLGLANRTLYVRMRAHVGLAPKRMLRIQRLHRTLASCHNRSMPWSQVSAMCGFADQAHLVREFQDLLGEAPGVWQERS